MSTRFTILLLLVLAPAVRAAEPTFDDVRPLLAKHCIACHDAKNAEGEFVLDTHAHLMKGGESGPAIVPGKADESPLIRQVEHKDKPFMPPPKKGDRLTPDEVALLRAYVNAGAKAPADDKPIVALATATASLPKVTPRTAPRRSIHAIAYEPKSKLLAVAVLNEIELRSAENQATVATLRPHTGHVNALAFSADGTKLIAAAGDPGLVGEISVWNVADGKLLKRFEGHKDAIYAVAISADGKQIATGSYDQKIVLWSAADGAKLRELAGHNGAVFDVAFRPDGKVLASASADRTVKLWDTATGNRLDTRSEPTKEQLTVAFSPDGRRVYAAGGDNRVRVWKVSPSAAEGTNLMQVAQFAHEGAILRLALSQDGKTLVTSSDDKTVKLWDAEKIEPRRSLEPQPDWPAAVAFALDSKVVTVGRLDGSLGFYETATGKKVASPKPELTNLEPRGIQQGRTMRLKLTGKDVATTTSVKVVGNDKLTATLLPPTDRNPNQSWAELTAAPDAPLGAFDLVATGPGGTSAPQKVIVDDLPQVEEAELPANATPPAGSRAHATTLPVTFGGNLTTRGDTDAFTFDARSNQTVVIDCAAKRFGSRADPVVSLFDPAGRLLATSAADPADPDPLIVQTLPTAGRYTLQVTDLQGAGSAQHYYRVSVGQFPYVTNCFPLAVPPEKESAVRLIGANLPAGAAVKVKAPAAGEVALPLDRALYRTRRPIPVLVGLPNETVEREPNDAPDRAMSLSLPSGVSGSFSGHPDYYRIDARADQPLVLETQAAMRGSAADTKIEILWPDGRPVERVQLRAVRDSHITFRPIDANAVGARLMNWEEMELDQYLYLQGEVVRLFLYPRGPDSEYNFYALGGRRRTYFDTSSTAHALEEKCYIVEPHKPGESLPATGLPAFKINYANDDDELRQLGSDSRLSFTAPKDGPYLIRVSDARDFSGPRLVYRLVVRPAKPDFTATIEGLNPTVPQGSGRGFTIRVNRIDNFDGPVTVKFEGDAGPLQLSREITVEAGQVEAQGALFAPPAQSAASAASAAPIQLKATAIAMIGGRAITKPLPDLPKLTVAGKPVLSVTLQPVDPKQTGIAIHPGQRVPALLRAARNGFKGPLSFEVDNLPHGVIVADIGLNGVLIPDGEEERQIFLQCAPWVTPQTRPCHARALQADGSTSGPVSLKVAP